MSDDGVVSDDAPQSDEPQLATEDKPKRAPTRFTPWRKWRRRRRRLFFTGVGVFIALVALLGASLGYLIYRNDQIHHIAVRNLVKIPSTGVENILMIGSTSRCALKQQNAAFGLCSQGVTGVNSDVILLMHLDPVHRRISILSIPRDTFIPNARPNETNRIDSALAYGPSQLVKAIEQDFGLPINHFVVLNFDSFQGVVNALGGLKMYFPDPVKDAYSSLNVDHTGCIHLNGFEALAVVRARHMQYEVDGKWYYDGSGDLGRILRDHEFLRVLASALAKRSLGNPITDNDIFGAIAPQLEVDQGFGLHEMINLVLNYHSVNPNNAPQLTLPVLIDPSFTYLYDGANYGSIVFPSEPQDLAAISTFTKQPLPGRNLKPKNITVSVEGGIGSTAATAATAAQLRALGFDVVGTTEVASVGPISETDVLYKPGDLPQGDRLLEEFRGAVALGQDSTYGNADVTVVTGSDFSIKSPQATSSASNGTTGTSGLTAAVNLPGSTSAVQLASFIEVTTLLASATSELTPPTQARSPLPSYDPRACPTPKKTKRKSTSKKS